MYPSDFPHPKSPLPGTGSPKRALFIDRWGTLLALPKRGACARFSDAEFYPGSLDALFRASQSGWLIYLIGNEDSVARGRISIRSWERFEKELITALAAHGIPIQRNYACLDHPAHGKADRMKDSVFLLPNTGIMYHAMQHDGIELDGSWVIGDGRLELAAGWRAGCRLMGLRCGAGMEDEGPGVEVDFRADDLAEALREVLTLETSS